MYPPHRTDRWHDSAAYESYVGRWSRQVAPLFVAWLGMPPRRTWVDIGCGTGALTQAILLHGDPARVTGVEPSAGFLEAARASVADDRVAFHNAGAERLPLPDDSCDVAVSGLVLNFVPDAPGALGEQRRVVRPAGLVAAYVWDYAGRMELMRCFWDAAVALDPAAREQDEAVRFPFARGEALAELWRASGLERVEVREIDIPTVFADFDAYWRPFLSGQAPAPGYCMSLSEERRAALRERLRATLPVRGDGSIHLIARALAVKGRVPA